jgi:hypothetical protein
MNAKQIIKLLEEISEVYDSPLVTYTKERGARVKKVHPIYVNPTKADYAEIYKEGKHTEIKFIAIMETKKVYVWDAFYAIHETVAGQLGLGNNWDLNPEIFTGTAVISSGKATMGVTDRFDFLKLAKDAAKVGQDGWSGAVNALATQLQMDWSWLDRYVDCKKYLTSVKSKINSIHSLTKKSETYFAR